MRPPARCSPSPRCSAPSPTVDLDRQCADPGKGFSDGPFATEAELRELVDLAEATEVIESGERRMIHSVFDLGDTIVREVMVPRTDMVFIEEYKTASPGGVLALRVRLQPNPGRSRRAGRRGGGALPQGRDQAGLRLTGCPAPPSWSAR